MPVELIGIRNQQDSGGGSDIGPDLVRASFDERLELQDDVLERRDDLVNSFQMRFVWHVEIIIIIIKLLVFSHPGRELKLVKQG